MTSVLSAHDLGKSFGAVVAASGLSMEVPAGQRVSLIGSNGAGKTTFVNMVTGYLKPDTGRILLEGRDITRAALTAALCPDGVQDVELTQPAASIVVGPTQAALCQGVTLTYGGLAE